MKIFIAHSDIYSEHAASYLSRDPIFDTEEKLDGHGLDPKLDTDSITDFKGIQK